jgi:hypothetical protein
MAFKMKAGKEGPMKKNFGSAMNFNAGLRAASKAGKLDNNPKFKAAVDKAPTKAMKDDAPMMRMEKGAMKKMGSPKKIDLNFSGGQEAKKTRESEAKRDFLKNWKTLSDEQKRNVPDKFVEMYGVTKPKNPAKGQLGGLNENAQK